MSDLIYLSGRISFPSLVEKRVSKKFPNSPAMFSADIIMPQNAPCFQEFMKVVAAKAQEAWKENTNGVLQMIQADRRARCYGAGEEKKSETTFQIHPGYAGNVWVSARNSDRPQMIRLDGKPAANDLEAIELARKIYGGCHCNVVVRPWIRLANRGVSCDLIAVQFVRDDEAFGDGASSIDVASMFSAVASSAPAAPTGGFPAFLMPQ